MDEFAKAVTSLAPIVGPVGAVIGAGWLYLWNRRGADANTSAQMAAIADWKMLFDGEHDRRVVAEQRADQLAADLREAHAQVWELKGQLRQVLDQLEQIRADNEQLRGEVQQLKAMHANK
jgi:hypothetical protein